MKFRAYESKTLADTFVIVAQLEAQIEQLVEAGNKIEDLPSSLIPTDRLYTILLCYGAMYNMLTAEHLLQDGAAKQTKSYH